MDAILSAFLSGVRIDMIIVIIALVYFVYALLKGLKIL